MRPVLEIAGGYLVLMTLAIGFFTTLCRAGARLDEARERDRTGVEAPAPRVQTGRRRSLIRGRGPAGAMRRGHLATSSSAHPRR